MNNNTFKKSGKVLNIEIISENTFIISCDNGKLEFFAEADCCSVSWFEFPNDVNFLIGKKITNMAHTKEIEMTHSGRQESDKNSEYMLHLECGNTLTFLLRNSSNGYYSGFISSNFYSDE